MSVVLSICVRSKERRYKPGLKVRLRQDKKIEWGMLYFNDKEKIDVESLTNG